MLEEFLEMKLFFFTTTLAVVLIAGLVAAALWYVVRILRTLDAMVREVREAMARLREDLDAAEEVAHESVHAVRSLLGLVGMGRQKIRRTPRRQSKEEGEHNAEL